MAREGLTIESQTLWDQLDALATVLQPTYEALRHHVLAAPVIGADETWWRLMGGPESKRWWAWSVTREDAVAYTILESRSQDAARQVLNGYRGIVVADGYGAYDALARAGPSFTLAHCWAHVRRKFVEAEAHYPTPCAEVLELIGLRRRARVSGSGRRRARRAPGESPGAPRDGAPRAVGPGRGGNPRLGPPATGVARERPRQSDRLHARALEGPDPLP
jgi:hypothetical protein